MKFVYCPMPLWSLIRAVAVVGGLCVLLHPSLCGQAPAPIATNQARRVAASWGKNAKKASQQPENEAVAIGSAASIGIQGESSVFQSPEDNRPVFTLKSGAQAVVSEVRGKWVCLKGDAGEGWVLRPFICSNDEFQRRSRENQLPRNLILVGADKNGARFYGGEIGIASNRYAPADLDGIWTDPTMEGQSFTIGGQTYSGDTNRLLIYLDAQKRFISMPAWQNAAVRASGIRRAQTARPSEKDQPKTVPAPLDSQSGKPVLPLAEKNKPDLPRKL